MANTKKYLSHLLQNTDITPACSEEERAAAELIAGVFSKHGFEPEMQEFSASASAKVAQAGLGIAAFVGAVLMGVGGVAGVAGFLLALAAAVIFVLERSGRPVLSQLGSGGLSQNVIAYHKASGPLASPRNRPVVVVAHYDSPRADFLCQPQFAPYRPLISKLLPIAMVAPAALAFIRLFPLPDAAKVVLWLLAIVAALVPLANGVAIIANRFVLPYTTGAVCNKSSVAAMLGVMDAVSPYQGIDEFPQDVPADHYFEEQRRAAEEAAAAAAAEAAAAEAAAAAAQQAEQTDAGDGDSDWGEPSASDVPGSVETPSSELEATVVDVLGETSAMSVDGIEPAVEEEGEEVPAATDSDDVIPAEIEPASAAPAEDALPEYELASEDEPAGGEFAYGDVEPTPAADEFAPVGSEPEAASVEEGVSPLNSEGNIRFGADAIQALGMLPADCKLVYEAEEQTVDEPAAADEPDDCATEFGESEYAAESEYVAEPEDAFDAEEPADQRPAPAPVEQPDAPEEEPVFEEEPEEDEPFVPAMFEQLASGVDPATGAGWDVPGDYDGQGEAYQDDAPIDVSSDEELIDTGDEEYIPETEAYEEPEGQDAGDEQTGDDELKLPQLDFASEENAPTGSVAPGPETAPVQDAASAPLPGTPEPMSTVDTTAEDTQLFEVPAGAADDPSHTIAMEQPVDTVDSLMAQISPKPAPRPQRTFSVPSTADAPVPRTPETANRGSLFDLPDPAASPADPFGADQPARPAAPSRNGFTVISSNASVPAPASDAAGAQEEPLDTISASEPEQEKPRRGLARFFGRKKKRRDSMSDWLGVDDDFDAKDAGRDIGSWDNFEGDDSGWKGGATGSADMTEEELREAVASMGDDELLGHDIWFVATGASENGNAGIHAFLNTHRDKLRGVFLINLESVGAGRIAMLATEGEQRVLKGDKRIMRLVSRVGSDFHRDIATVDMPYVTTDAYPAMSMSLRSLTVAGVEGTGFALSHTEEDHVLNVDLDNVAMVSDVVTEVIRRS